MCQCVCSLHPFHPLPNTVMPKEKRFKPKVSCIELEESHHAANSQDSLLHQASIGTQLMCRTVGSTFRYQLLWDFHYSMNKCQSKEVESEL